MGSGHVVSDGPKCNFSPLLVQLPPMAHFNHEAALTCCIPKVVQSICGKLSSCAFFFLEFTTGAIHYNCAWLPWKLPTEQLSFERSQLSMYTQECS